MPLIPQVLELQILAAFQKMSSSEKELAVAQADLARDLATAIDTYIKTATIIVQPGQVVTGAGGGVPGPMTGATVTPSAPALIT